MSKNLNARMEHGILRAISWGAVVVAAILVIVLAIRIVSLLASPTLVMTDLGMVLQGTPVEQTSTLPEHVVSIETLRSSITIEGMPAGIRWLLVAEQLLRATLGLGMCLAAFVLGRSLMAGRPFDRAAIWAIFTVAVAVPIAGLIAPFLHAIAEAETLRFVSGGALESTRDTGFTQGGALVFGMEIDLAPLGITFGLAALLAAFEAGSRMQRETEGLV